MDIAILAARDNWYFRDLARAGGSRHRLTAISYKSLGSHVAGANLSIDGGGVSLNSLDAVLVRSMPPGSLEQVVFRMDALARIEAAGLRVVNPARAIEAAVDKFLATAKLQVAGLLVPPTIVCQTAADGLAAFETLGGDVVVKPLFGGEGRGITRVSDVAIARRVFSSLEQIGSVLYLQQFVPHDGVDWRLLVIGDEVLGMKRINPNDWRTNISLGARPAPLEVTIELAQLARRAAAAVGATVAGVDLLPARDGRLYAIEVNAVPGWRALGEVTGVDVAERVLGLLSDL
ncbi:ATP-grasp domain-containing protein [Lacipirellula limnantheis]|uniref:Alpha-aminoadipate--LysW ligase LysX n=1 Tax=Lacipirellula limnantheis TaxID=2528024 RepID=A0A517TUG2_9BACT|nr:RimK family alpha-L-glutamate ligase [Lacipirellula limnantheis]QDT72007.1 Alpha-aminoadipate--LysW ligase LysX [Lacipirellula limnantheis]